MHQRQTPKPSAEDIERAFPEAVEVARRLREHFGDGVKILYARNAACEEIGKRPPWRAPCRSADESDLHSL